jgi:hypothetical protein
MAVEVITRTPPCDFVIVNGAVGRVTTRRSCRFAMANVRQTVGVNQNILSWSFKDAGSGCPIHCGGRDQSHAI